MKRPIPETYQLVRSGEDVALRTAELAAEISTWAAKLPKGEQLLAVCILRGAVYFTADLLRALSVSAEPGFCRSWGYSTTDISSQLTDGRIDMLGLSPQGRTILLVDDICDTGSTFQRVRDFCIAQGAKEVRTVALMHRVIPNQVLKPDWVGFTYEGDGWLVGLGLDDCDTNGNLPAVYYIRK